MILSPQRALRSSPFLVAFSLCVFLLFTAGLFLHGSRSPLSLPDKAAPEPEEALKPVERTNAECSSDLKFLCRPGLDLTERIRYSRRCVKPTYGKPERDVVKHLREPIITNMKEVDLKNETRADLPPCEPLSLEVSHPYPQKEYPHLIFGVASGYNRMNESLAGITHWLSGTGARLIGVVVDAEDEGKNFDLEALEAEYEAHGIAATFLPPQLKKLIPIHGGQAGHNPQEEGPIPVDHHHFMLIRDLMAYATPQTQWLGILDDDTFFPSLYPLDAELSKYDYKKSYWLGALTDDFNHVKIWNFMAFGGAGVFVSMPLAREIEPLLEQCISESTVNSGDGILRDCMFRHSRTRLTIVPGLYQHDILTDSSGFYESGVQPLSLHHWKSWYQEPIPAQASVAAICGDCYLQRWTFGENTLFANGYSISVYADGLNSVDFNRIEGTWEHPGPEYDFSYGPLREKLPDDKKKSFRLKDAEVMSNGYLRQIYVYRNSTVVEETMDEVVELLWER